METNSTAKRGLLVGGVLLLWLLGIMWTLDSKGIVRLPGSNARGSGEYAHMGDDEGGGSSRSRGDSADPEAIGDDPVLEIVLDRGPSEEELAEQARLAALAAATDDAALTPEVDVGPPTFPVWFESERDIGVCKIRYDSGSKTANLHVATRLPEGRVSFSYHCGKYSGRAAIDVEPKRVNGVLFCKRGGDVSVEIVRSKDGRCGR